MVHHRLKQVLDEKKVTVYSLSQLTKIGTSNLYIFRDNPEKSMSFSTLNKICAALGLKSINELIEYIPDNKPDEEEK